MDLEERNKRVLQAVIDSYIASGSPVGSAVLAKRYEFGRQFRDAAEYHGRT